MHPKTTGAEQGPAHVRPCGETPRALGRRMNGRRTPGYRSAQESSERESKSETEVVRMGERETEHWREREGLPLPETRTALQS